MVQERPLAVYGSWSRTSQLDICQQLAKSFGFDFNAGGMDYTDHPFCVSAGPRDVRLTMRYLPERILSALSATAHETGHGLLEQNKSKLLHWGLPYGFAYSLSTHESQSRLWQNHVFGSREFWEFFGPKLRDVVPENVGLEASRYYHEIHAVRPSLIRIDADEVTYALHIAIRVQLELALISGELAVKDLPEVWNNLYEQLLGVRPKTDAEGCLQDIHWSSGSFGYFGTYLLGSMGAAQQFAEFSKYNPQWSEVFSLGRFELLLNWLRSEVYPTALTMPFKDTMTRATSEPLNPQYWEDHIRSTYGQSDTDIVRTGSGGTIAEV
jgi:carboxypeptidase Taq